MTTAETLTKSVSRMAGARLSRGRGQTPTAQCGRDKRTVTQAIDITSAQRPASRCAGSNPVEGAVEGGGAEGAARVDAD
ncbi:unnamed protein product [Protopolystoma xenopodis]|uniref:Uncharacterized protein n=1 Tax=Protopolystoma xenopodis TaxID=117903 RepID=A0A448XJB4_9PLAT|nr:unnamed protein product [Protopolystoma xenopodis]